MAQINLMKIAIGPLEIQGIANVKNNSEDSLGALVQPSIVFILKEDDIIKTSLLCSSFELRSASEALREVLQKKVSSRWSLSKRGMKISISASSSNVGSSKDEDHWCWLNVDVSGLMESVPLSVWELRALIKQLDFFSESLESECFKIMKDKNFIIAKAQMSKNER